MLMLVQITSSASNLTTSNVGVSNFFILFSFFFNIVLAVEHPYFAEIPFIHSLLLSAKVSAALSWIYPDNPSNGRIPSEAAWLKPYINFVAASLAILPARTNRHSSTSANNILRIKSDDLDLWALESFHISHLPSDLRQTWAKHYTFSVYAALCDMANLVITANSRQFYHKLVKFIAYSKKVLAFFSCIKILFSDSYRFVSLYLD